MLNLSVHFLESHLLNCTRIPKSLQWQMPSIVINFTIEPVLLHLEWICQEAQKTDRRPKRVVAAENHREYPISTSVRQAVWHAR